MAYETPRGTDEPGASKKVIQMAHGNLTKEQFVEAMKSMTYQF
jgi:hypothetical protein